MNKKSSWLVVVSMFLCLVIITALLVVNYNGLSPEDVPGLERKESEVGIRGDDHSSAKRISLSGGGERVDEAFRSKVRVIVRGLEDGKRVRLSCWKTADSGRSLVWNAEFLSGDSFTKGVPSDTPISIHLLPGQSIAHQKESFALKVGETKVVFFNLGVQANCSFKLAEVGFNNILARRHLLVAFSSYAKPGVPPRWLPAQIDDGGIVNVRTARGRLASVFFQCANGPVSMKDVFNGDAIFPVEDALYTIKPAKRIVAIQARINGKLIKDFFLKVGRVVFKAAGGAIFVCSDECKGEAIVFDNNGGRSIISRLSAPPAKKVVDLDPSKTKLLVTLSGSHPVDQRLELIGPSPQSGVYFYGKQGIKCERLVTGTKMQLSFTGLIPGVYRYRWRLGRLSTKSIGSFELGLDVTKIDLSVSQFKKSRVRLVPWSWLKKQFSLSGTSAKIDGSRSRISQDGCGLFLLKVGVSDVVVTFSHPSLSFFKYRAVLDWSKLSGGIVDLDFSDNLQTIHLKTNACVGGTLSLESKENLCFLRPDTCCNFKVLVVVGKKLSGFLWESGRGFNNFLGRLDITMMPGVAYYEKYFSGRWIDIYLTGQSLGQVAVTSSTARGDGPVVGFLRCNVPGRVWVSQEATSLKFRCGERPVYTKTLSQNDHFVSFSL